MNDKFAISRRAFTGGAVVLGLGGKAALAQGFAGLGMTGDGFASVIPGKPFAFPADHGAHPDYRIEWWYVTANLVDPAGIAYGAQWTLFRQAMQPGAQQEGWANQQIWMGHAAVTRADTHRYSETYFKVAGSIAIDDKPAEVTGRAWMDREWSSQPLASDQTGWDWFSLHLNENEKLMLFRLRQADGNNYRSGNWTLSAGKPEQLASADIEMTPTAFTEI